MRIVLNLFLNLVNLAVRLFSYFGLEVNFAKSSLVPSQRIDFPRYFLDAKNCQFSLTQDKLFKCWLIVKCLSRLRSIRVKLLQRIVGFLNFVFQLFPFGRSFIRPWYKSANREFKISQRGRGRESLETIQFNYIV